MLQAAVWFKDGKILGQFYRNSVEISKLIFFTNREQAETFMAKAFGHSVNHLWLGKGMSTTLYVTKFEDL